MKSQLLPYVLLALVGCASGSGQSARSLVGDGNQPASAVARDETVVIGYGSGDSTDRAIQITIEPGGKVIYEAHKRTSLVWKKILTKYLDHPAISKVKNQLSLFRPPEENAEGSVVPVGCHWTYDAPDAATIIFIRRGQSARWVHVQTNCKSFASSVLLHDLSKVINDRPLSAVSLGLKFLG